MEGAVRVASRDAVLPLGYLIVAGVGLRPGSTASKCDTIDLKSFAILKQRECVIVLANYDAVRVGVCC